LMRNYVHALLLFFALAVAACLPAAVGHSCRLIRWSSWLEAVFMLCCSFLCLLSLPPCLSQLQLAIPAGCILVTVHSNMTMQPAGLVSTSLSYYFHALLLFLCACSLCPRACCSCSWQSLLVASRLLWVKSAAASRPCCLHS
jgi:hypothetical protein